RSHQVLNLVGSFEYIEDFGISVKLLDDMLLQPDGTEEFQTLGADVKRDFSRIGFTHGGFLGIGLTDIRLPGRFPCEQSGSLNIQFRVSQQLRRSMVKGALLGIFAANQI